MKILNIVSSGYRATLEEQDDTVLWISQVLRKNGANIDLLLRNAAVNYIVEGQQVAPLTIGGRAQRNAPDVHSQVRGLAENGSRILVVEEDLRRYGLDNGAERNWVEVIGDRELPPIVADYDMVWHW